MALIGAVEVIETLTFLIKVLINSWKRSFFGEIIGVGVAAGVRADSRFRKGSEPGVIEPRAGCLKTDLLRRIESIVER